ncbi:ATP-dependent DNA ligase [Methanothrix soehngenii]|jgi:DNA ligase-1|uniref:ATP-dependent DNA ligase n=1 Tax=Methanothrix soehngenii TaxID=2223 RepID=UPI0023F25B56|nr:ATP-dependent DNA ligase [Methanothrix soehngenii]MCK9585608.1 ATP-dependent DNA ligase [Methanothrix soehngenii]MDD4487450.1 ATP-dependent DNA ligase [Methanothrix soehngenii]MDD5256236.1 ATP-dependent DNA ligase [Methanothrix soehngenii]MDD5734432.1 ATP-dependent DNA ligase [Methanothrix soehngenii]
MSSFLSFAELCQRVEGVSGSLEKVVLVAAFLKNLDDDELAVASGFIMGDLFSPSLDLVMGVGPSILYEAMARACGCSTERISDMLRATGDPGLVASAAVDKKKPIGFAAFIKDEPLSIKEVYQRLVAVARASGKGSQDAKVKNLQYLFSQATPLEAQYIARLAIEDMRIGIGEGGVRDAIAQAFSQDASKVERAYNLTNDIGLVAVNARKGTLADLNVLINHPIKMMLAQVGEGISASMQELGSAAIEWKYDGARVQIHKDGKRVRIFSRRLEDVTRSLPEIVRLAQEVRADKAILDGEVVAIGKDSRPLAFQEILKRFRRKYNVEKQAKETPLHLFLFDLIYLDGQSTVDLPLTRRRELLEGIADPSILADQVISDSVQKAEEIYHQALEKGHEGLILKNSMSVYAPGKRGKNWLKIKPVMETLDLAVIGAKWGEGRRASFLGSYRLACLDEATSKLLDIGWVATGLTDEALAELTELFRELILVQNGMEVELKPAVIFEVAYEEIQKSQSYSSGYALRFPRLVRVRDDKSLEEADSLERVESLYRVQRGRNNSR